MTPEIKQRISEIQSGTVPEGYRKGKIGIVPAEWEDTLFSTLFTSTSDYTDDLTQYPLYSLTIEDGITAKTEKYERSYLVKKNNAYKIVRPNDYAYNPMNIRFGAVARHKGSFPVAVSGYYDIFTTVHDSDLAFMDNFLTCDAMITYYNKVSTGSLVEKQRVHFSDFMNFSLPLPSLSERKKIAEIFTTQDQLIALQQSKLDELKRLKKACLDKMFPKNGSDVPEVRFPGFTGDWEQRKLGEVVDVRGGMDYKHLQEGEIPVYGTGGYMLSVNEALSYTEDAIGIGRKGTIDKPYILKAPFWTVDTLFYAVPRNKFDLNFVFDIFQNVDWKKKDESTGVPSLSKTTINDVDVLVPSLHEQQQIGTFFATLDELISLHQHKLDEMKRLKKGLMQVLLMGIVRVDEGKESEV
ncbi:MAG: restriction endonuclease subunit S [Oscillospiraceae bacterium]|nr:restriction endonuclease subunit S [Oscillospiraceae bacterium]